MFIIDMIMEWCSHPLADDRVKTNAFEVLSCQKFLEKYPEPTKTE